LREKEGSTTRQTDKTSGRTKIRKGGLFVWYHLFSLILRIKDLEKITPTRYQQGVLDHSSYGIANRKKNSGWVRWDDGKSVRECRGRRVVLVRRSQATRTKWKGKRSPLIEKPGKPTSLWREGVSADFHAGGNYQCSVAIGAERGGPTGAFENPTSQD